MVDFNNRNGLCPTRVDKVNKRLCNIMLYMYKNILLKSLVKSILSLFIRKYDWKY